MLTLTGEVTSARDGIHFGIKVKEAGRPALRAILDGTAGSVTVSAPQGGRAQLTGTLSMSGRRPLQWVANEGVSRLDLSRVTEVDSSGLGLMLLMNERSGVTVENCSPHVCALIKLCGTPALCAPECPKAEAAHA
ncbi:MAG: hypothetical protein HXX15_22855 [Rhodopseudomonas sp.]|nr:hypothetical protein [Rhodopseudomonas sp.]